MPDHSYSTTIDLDDATTERQFRRFIQNMANGSAPGLSGWTGDMLKVIYSDARCRKGLAQLIQDICNGVLSDEAKQYILPSHLVPVPKPNRSIRPISMGEIFYRAASHYAVDSVSHVIADTLGPMQFGVGRPAGVEQAVHQLQHLLTRTDPERLAGIAVDFKNAFNERNRVDILNELYQHQELQPIWRIVNWAYSDPSALWIREVESSRMIIPDADLTSAEGVKQGDPLGSLLFALSMKLIYDKAVESDTTNSVTSVAFLDDCTLIGLPDERLLKAFEVLKSVASEGGLEVNLSKTKFLWLHETGIPLPEDLERKLEEMGTQIERGATMLLGAPIGTDEQKMKQLVMKGLDEQKQFFDRLKSSSLPIQEALIMLRVCALPRLNFFCRTTPPRILYPAAVAFDQLMYETFNSKLNLQLPIAIDDEKANPLGCHIQRAFGSGPHSSSNSSSTSTFSSSSSSSSSSVASLAPLDSSSVRARMQAALPIRLAGIGLRSIVQ